MELENNWKETDLNIDSLWIIGPRAKGGKRENNYHGNFTPQIPNEMIQRYTNPGDVVLDMFMGSGTTLYECELLNRDFIGFDINEEMIEYVRSKMVDTKNIQFFIHNNDITDAQGIKQAIESDLTLLKKKSTELIISHPPYWDIIKFTDKKEDLSNIVELESLDRKSVV